MRLSRKISGSESDETLIERFKKEGDLNFLGTLYQRYTTLVYGVCLKYFKNREDSQDAVMQIFEVLIREIPRHEIQYFKSWLYRVTTNYCLMQLRKNKGVKFISNSIIPADFMENTEDLHPLDKEEAHKKVSETLSNCMETLKIEQKQCVEQFYYHNKCYKEIAALLNLEEKKVKSYIQNGKRNLRICIEKHEKISSE